jgi:P-type E1-E2 ATPase
MVGDLLKLKEGMEVPADGLIVQGFSIKADESSMTGETRPMHKDPLDKCNEKKN